MPGALIRRPARRTGAASPSRRSTTCNQPGTLRPSPIGGGLLRATTPIYRETATNGGAVMYDLPMTNLSAALAQIDKANVRLARTTIAERFTYVLDPYTREEANALGIATAQQRVHLTLSAPGSGSAAGYSSPAWSRRRPAT